jgi:hypothetical protein
MGIHAEEVLRRGLHAVGATLHCGATVNASGDFDPSATLALSFVDKAHTAIKRASITRAGHNDVAINAAALAGGSLPLGCTLKEKPDVKGADFIVLHRAEESDAPSIHNDRFQLKLGSSTFGKGDAEEVVRKLQLAAAVDNGLSNLLTAAGSRPVAVRSTLYLATTRPLVGDAAAVLAAAGVIVWGRKKLAELWPRCVQVWANREPVTEAYTARDV